MLEVQLQRNWQYYHFSCGSLSDYCLCSFLHYGQIVEVELILRFVVKRCMRQSLPLLNYG